MQSSVPICASCKYSPRCINSKGALLVFIWTLLLIISSICMFISLQVPKYYINFGSYIAILASPCTFLVVCPLSGWLADARYGNYRIVKIGFLVTFVATISTSLCVLILENTEVSFTIAVIAIGTVTVIWSAGVSMCAGNMLQLGLDQMPTASSSNITSFIAWYVFCFFGGFWIVTVLMEIPEPCITNQETTSLVKQSLTLLPAICLSCILISDYLLAPKWLIIEPKSPQSLKTIYQVLKFAAKNKAAINRSALTYWENDIPSRIDLGKSRYGGPFTTEQVEDVKTILRLCVVTIPLWFLSATSVHIQNIRSIDIVSSPCFNTLIASFTYNALWCVIVGTLIYEFAVYPFIKHWLPTILKRLGIVIFCLVLLNTVSLILWILDYKQVLAMNPIVNKHIMPITYNLLLSGLASTAFELVCAQAPYNMRSLFVGYMEFVLYSMLLSNGILNYLCNNLVKGGYSVVVHYSIIVIMSLISFLLHCVLAHWYKRRVRDDGYVAQAVIEEVYDRYLSMR